MSRRRSSSVQDQQDNGGSNTDSNTLGLGRVSPAVLADLQAHISAKGLELLGTQLVVNKASQGNRVTEELLGSDGITEDHHGGADQEDILEDTSHGQDDGRSLANL